MPPGGLVSQVLKLFPTDTLTVLRWLTRHLGTPMTLAVRLETANAPPGPYYHAPQGAAARSIRVVLARLFQPFDGGAYGLLRQSMRLLAYGREIDCGELGNRSVVIAGNRDHIRY